MECAAGTDAIKVAPKGCKPVSKDRCASGFMAPVENVLFPKNPLETCCKCRAGEICAYCLGDECTQGETKKYVTEKDCFSEEKQVESSLPSQPKKKKQLFTMFDFISYTIFIILAGAFITVYFNILPNSELKSSAGKYAGLFFVITLAGLIIKKIIDFRIYMSIE